MPLVNSPSMGLRISALIFGIICLAHVWRVVAHVHVRVGTHSIPMWASVVAIVVSGGLSLWCWRLSTNRII